MIAKLVIGKEGAYNPGGVLHPNQFTLKQNFIACLLKASEEPQELKVQID